MQRVPIVLSLAVFVIGATLSIDGNEEPSGLLMVSVSWDYGSEPGKDSNRWVGKREVPIQYESGDCAKRFKLKTVRHEYVLVDPDTGKKSPPAFIVATLQKLVAGAVEPPYLKIVRPEATGDGKKTKREHVDAVGFRLDFPPNRIDNWEDADIEITLSVPNHNVHNPFDWTEVIVACK